MTLLGGWLSISLQILTLITIAYSAIKVINKNEREWIQREERIKLIEEEMQEMRNTTKDVGAIGTRLLDVCKEMERVRNRLDSFLDNQMKNK